MNELIKILEKVVSNNNKIRVVVDTCKGSMISTEFYPIGYNYSENLIWMFYDDGKEAIVNCENIEFDDFGCVCNGSGYHIYIEWDKVALD